MSEPSQPLPSLLPVPSDWGTPEAAATTGGPGRRPVALALGGLGGFNNHVGGVLTAALESDLQPALVSCTSGAVAWAADYLAALHEPGQTKDQRLARLRAVAQKAATRTGILPRDVRVSNDALIGLFGRNRSLPFGCQRDKSDSVVTI